MRGGKLSINTLMFRSRILARMPGLKRYYKAIVRRVKSLNRVAVLKQRVAELELANYRLRSELNRAVAACADERSKRLAGDRSQ